MCSSLLLQDGSKHLIDGLGLLDAHAAWHLATIPLTLMFYSFLRRDASLWVSNGMT
jgi:hypothetical protein